MSASSGVSIQSSYKFIAVTPRDSLILKYPTTTTPYPTQGSVNTPSQVIDEPAQTRGLSCAVAGNVAVKNDQGTAVTIFLSAGAIHPISTYQVMSTNTTATGIVAYF